MSQTKQKHVIISHEADLDGVASAILLTYYIQFKYRVKPTVLFASYEEVNNIIQKATDTDATHLWIADLSIRNLDVVDCLTRFTPETLHFFDHHGDTASFVEAIKSHSDVHFDISGTKCAADLIWEFFIQDISNARDAFGKRFPDALVCLAHLVKATHSRDLWVNNVPEGVDISAVIAMLGPDKSYEHLMEGIHRVYRDNFTDLMEFCVHVSEDLMTNAKDVARASTIRYFYLPDSPSSCAAGLSVVVAMTIGCQSDVGDMFLQERPRTIVGLLNLEKLRFSFRTTQEVIQQLGFGVNEIAKTIEGGGGHPYAAGAPMTTEMLLQGPKGLLSLMTSVIDEKVFEREGIKAR